MLKDGQDIEVRTLVSEFHYWQNQKHHNLDKLNIVPIFDGEYLNIFEANLTFADIWRKIVSNDLSQIERANYKEVILRKLGGWKPDIAVYHGADFFNNVILPDAFPDVLIMTADNAIFSRPPFMRSLFYAPNFPAGSFTFRYKQEINNFELSVKQNKIIEELKHSIVQIIDANMPDCYKEFNKNIRNKFDKIVLLPMYGQETLTEDEFLYFKRVMEKIPKNIGVIFSSHDNLTSNDLILKVKMYHQRSYKNLIYFNEENKLNNSNSLPFLSLVDAIINNNTATGLQGCIFGKKVISMDKTFSAWFSDKAGLDNIEDFLDTTARSKNGMLYWCLTHYAILEKRFNEGKWLFRYFQEKLEHFKKKGITFDFYGQNEDISELSQYVLDYVKDYYKNLPQQTGQYVKKENEYQVQMENLIAELNQAKKDKYKHLPKSIGLFLSCFIAKKKNRSQFRNKYVKGF
jgi:hypothetical protein